MTFEEAKKMAIAFCKWEKTSHHADDLWRKALISDIESHLIIEQLFDLFTSNYYSKND